MCDAWAHGYIGVCYRNGKGRTLDPRQRIGECQLQGSISIVKRENVKGRPLYNIVIREGTAEIAMVVDVQSQTVFRSIT